MSFVAVDLDSLTIARIALDSAPLYNLILDYLV